MPSDKHNSIMAQDTDLNLLLLDVALSGVVHRSWSEHIMDLLDLPLFFFQCHFFSLTEYRCRLAVYCPGFLRGFLVKSPGSSIATFSTDDSVFRRGSSSGFTVSNTEGLRCDEALSTWLRSGLLSTL